MKQEQIELDPYNGYLNQQEIQFQEHQTQLEYFEKVQLKLLSVAAQLEDKIKIYDQVFQKFQQINTEGRKQKAYFQYFLLKYKFFRKSHIYMKTRKFIISNTCLKQMKNLRTRSLKGQISNFKLFRIKQINNFLKASQFRNTIKNKNIIGLFFQPFYFNTKQFQFLTHFTNFIQPSQFEVQYYQEQEAKKKQINDKLELFKEETQKIDQKTIIQEGNAKLLQKPYEKQMPVYISFRYSKQTAFKELRNAACKYWQLPLDKDKRGNEQDTYNNYQIFNEIGQQINDKDFVEKYFNQNKAEIKQGLILLKFIKPTLESESKAEKKTEAIKLDVQQQKNSLMPLKQLEKIDDLTECRKLFYNKMPYMQRHINVSLKEIKKAQKIGIIKEKIYFKTNLLYDGNHCCFLFIILSFLIINLILYDWAFPIKAAFLSNNHLNSIFQLDFMRDKQQEMTIQSIKSIEDFYNYLNTTIASNLFPADLQTDRIFQGKLRKVNQPRLRVYRPEYVYNNVEYPWQEYKTSQDNQIYSNIEGNFQKYNGDGYVFDFSKSSTQNGFRSDLALINKLNFIDYHTKAMFFTFTLYNHNQNIFYFIEIIFEFSYEKVLFSKFYLRAFRPNIYFSGNKGIYYLLLDIFKVALVLFLIVQVILQSTSKEQLEKENSRLQYFFSYQGITNMFIIVFLSISLGLTIKQVLLNIDDENLLQSSQFIDLNEVSWLYQISYQFNASALSCMIARLGSIFLINKRFALLIIVLEKSIKQIVRINIILLPLSLAIALTMTTVYGNYIEEFNTFLKSTLSFFMLSIGQISIQELIQANFKFTVLFFTVVILVFGYFFVSAYYALYSDIYRNSILESGYIYEKESIWTLKDYEFWLLSWLSIPLLNKLGFKNIQQKQN